MISLLLASLALAVPVQLEHQGRLMDSAGLPLQGANDLTVSLYDSTGGASVWSQDFNGYVFDNGYFAVELDGIPDAAFDADLWVGVAVNGGSSLGRQPVMSVPFARRAATATDLAGGTVDASEIRVNGTLVIDGSGNLATGQTLSGLSCSTDQFAVYNGVAWGCASASGLLDGDDDTLAALPCSDAQIARFQLATTSWVCSSDQTLDESAVDSMVSNNGFLASSDVAAVAISGAYGDLSGVPSLAAVATSGAYGDLSGAPTLAAVATSGAYADLSGAPTLAAVATSGAYADLSGAPTLAAVATSGAYGDLSGVPSLAAVATSGDYADLSNTPRHAVGSTLLYAQDAAQIAWEDPTAYRRVGGMTSSRAGSLRVGFDAYIQSGPDWWAWQITVDGTAVASGSYQDGLNPVNGASVHASRRYLVDINGVSEGSVVELWLKSSDNSGGGFGTGVDQLLHASRFRVSAAQPTHDAGVFGAATFRGYLSNAADLLSGGGGFVQITGKNNSNPDVYEVVGTGPEFGLRFLKPGHISWQYDQDIITSAGGYVWFRAFVGSISDQYQLISGTNGLWDALISNGVAEVTPGDVLRFQLGCSGCTVNALDEGTWSNVNVMWLGQLD